MGEHSMEKQKPNKKILLFFLIIIIACLGIYFVNKNKDIVFKEESTKTYTIKPKTVENEVLVLKSNSGDNRYIEFIFRDKVLSKLKIYEKFEDKDKYEEKKNQYETYDIFNLMKKKDRKLILEVEKTDLESDEGLTYEEVYDKYINQIIGAYEVVE